MIWLIPVIRIEECNGVVFLSTGNDSGSNGSRSISIVSAVRNDDMHNLSIALGAIDDIARRISICDHDMNDISMRLIGYRIHASFKHFGTFFIVWRYDGYFHKII